jgi:hypothetical protein
MRCRVPVLTLRDFRPSSEELTSNRIVLMATWVPSRKLLRYTSPNPPLDRGKELHEDISRRSVRLPHPCSPSCEAISSADCVHITKLRNILSQYELRTMRLLITTFRPGLENDGVVGDVEGVVRAGKSGYQDNQTVFFEETIAVAIFHSRSI